MPTLTAEPVSAGLPRWAQVGSEGARGVRALCPPKLQRKPEEVGGSFMRGAVSAARQHSRPDSQPEAAQDAFSDWGLL